MGTPASLLDVIARGGSIPGYNEAQQAQANIAHTQAETANLPITGQLQQAQVQRAQLENQEIQRQLDASKVISQIYQEGLSPTGSTPAIATPGIVNGPGGPPPSFLSDPMALAHEAMRRGVFPQYAFPAAQQMITLRSNAAKLGAEERANSEAVDAKVGSILQQVKALPPDQRSAAVQSDIPILEQLDPHTNWRSFDLTNDADLARLETAKVLHGTALAQAKTEQETKTSAAEAGQKTAEAKKAEAETGHIEFENNLLKGMANPADIEARAERIVPTAENPDIHQQLVRDLSTATSAEAIQAAQTKASGLALARTPGSIEAKAKESAAVERANLPFREAAARDIAQYSSGLEQNREATKLIQGALEDYKSADSAINGVKSVIADAKSGNSVSGSQAPGLAAAASLAMFNIKRLPANVTESMGTTWEKGVGALKSLADGVPQTTEKLNEIDKFLDLVRDANTNRYNGVKESVESTYKGVKAPEVAPTSTAPSANPYRAPQPTTAGTRGGTQPQIPANPYRRSQNQ